MSSAAFGDRFGAKAWPDPVRLPRDDVLLGAAADRLARGLLLFDADARVLACNLAARRMLRARPGLSLEPLHGDRSPGTLQLRASGAILQCEIEQAVQECAAPSAPALVPRAPGRRSPEPRRALRLCTEPGRPELLLMLERLGTPAPAPPSERAQRIPGVGEPPVGRAAPRAEPDRIRRSERAPSRMPDAFQPAVLGTLVDRARDLRLDTDRLCTLFGLSVSSARVAEAYLRADTVKDAARELGISTNTVKSHLAVVYDRTGCSRQSQLLRLLMSLAQGETA